MVAMATVAAEVAGVHLHLVRLYPFPAAVAVSAVVATAVAAVAVAAVVAAAVAAVAVIVALAAAAAVAVM